MWAHRRTDGRYTVLRYLRQSKKPRGAIGCGLLLAVFGLLALIGSLSDGNADTAAIAIVFVATGAFALYKGNSDRKAAENALQFVVRMRSASGQQQVFGSRDDAHVRRIVSALNTAIST